MDRFVVLKDISDEGIEKLHELQKQGILRIVEPNATILTWLTPDDLKTVVEDALESYGIKVSPEQVNELVDATYELWERADCGTSYDEIYYLACDIIDDWNKNKSEEKL